MDGGPHRGYGPTDNFGAGSAERSVIELHCPLIDAKKVLETGVDIARASALRRVVLLAEEADDASAVLTHLEVTSGGAVSLAGRWAIDVDNVAQLATAEAHLQGTAGPLVLCTTLFEQRRDPRRLLRFLKHVLLAEPGSRALLAGVDRRTFPAGEDGGLPHPGAFRHYSSEEAAAFFTSLGFRRERFAACETSAGIDASGWAIVLSYDKETADMVLRRRGLPSSDVRKMVVASPPGVATQDVETYRRASLRWSAEADVLRLALPGTTAAGGIDAGWLPPTVLGVDPVVPFQPESVLALVEQALVEFPQLQSLQCHDHQGLAACVVEANRVGELPLGFFVEVVAVGSQPFFERAHARWSGFDGLRMANDERTALEGADLVVFPTAYLATQYEQIGYQLPEYRVRHLPLEPTGCEKAREYGPIDVLVFVGRRDEAHGFRLFADAVAAAFEDDEMSPSVKTILVLGAPDVSMGAEAERLKNLRATCVYVENDLPLTEALREIQQLAPRALCVIPYLTEALPYVVRDAVATGCRVLASRRSGIPELFPMAVHEDVLFEPCVPALASAVVAACRMPPGARADVVRRVQAQVRFAEDRADMLGERDHGQARSRKRCDSKSALSLIVPCFNPRLPHLAELVWSLNQQTLTPARAIFVDDGSAADLSAGLERLLEEECRVPFLLVRHPVNRGLPAARNTGLEHVETAYVANLDSDDIAKNDFVRAYTEALDANPGAAAMTSVLDHFVDGRDWRVAGNTARGVYRPQGRGVALAQLDNCLGHANSAYRVEVLREVGGWDAEDRSMYEDYALHLRLVSDGQAIGVIPRALSLYRIRTNSMVRTYSAFKGEWRVGRNFSALDRFEGVRLQSLLRESRGTLDHARAEVERRGAELVRRQAEAESLKAELATLRAESATLQAELATLRAEVTARREEAASLSSALALKEAQAASLRAVLLSWGWSESGNALIPSEGRPLRYRLVDQVNQRLKAIPGIHALVKWVGAQVVPKVRRQKLP